MNIRSTHGMGTVNKQMEVIVGTSTCGRVATAGRKEKRKSKKEIARRPRSVYLV